VSLAGNEFDCSTSSQSRPLLNCAWLCMWAKANRLTSLGGKLCGTAQVTPRQLHIFISSANSLQASSLSSKACPISHKLRRNGGLVNQASFIQLRSLTAHDVPAALYHVCWWRTQPCLVTVQIKAKGNGCANDFHR